MTPSGPKRIEDIVAGDLVMARSDQFLADPLVRARPVLETYRFEHRQTLALSVQGKAIRDTLHTTPEHPFAVKIQPGDTRALPGSAIGRAEDEAGYGLSTGPQGHDGPGGLALLERPSTQARFDTAVSALLHNAQRIARDPSAYAWIKAEDLRVGDQLIDSEGQSLTVTALEANPGLTTVYNFAVETDHTYFVGHSKTWVHNTYDGATQSKLTTGRALTQDEHASLNAMIAAKRDAHTTDSMFSLRYENQSALGLFASTELGQGQDSRTALTWFQRMLVNMAVRLATNAPGVMYKANEFANSETGIRLTGGLQFLGGSAEVIGGGSLIVGGAGATATGAGAAPGVVAIAGGSFLILTGVDNATTGWRQMITGERQTTYLNDTLVYGFGIEPSIANQIEFGVGFAGGGVGSLATISRMDGLIPVSRIGTGESLILETGARRIVNPSATLYDPYAKAEDIYDVIRLQDDISVISRNTGWSTHRIQRVKEHLFYRDHVLDGRVGRFDAHPQIANAWDRLVKGDYIDNDIRLLEHEYFESRFEGIYKTNYRQAHEAAESSGRVWNAE